MLRLPISFERVLMKTHKQENFAVVTDVERDLIVDSGDYSDMLSSAERHNRLYQSTAYRAVKWNHGENDGNCRS